MYILHKVGGKTYYKARVKEDARTAKAPAAAVIGQIQSAAGPKIRAAKEPIVVFPRISRLSGIGA